MKTLFLWIALLLGSLGLQAQSTVATDASLVHDYTWRNYLYPGLWGQTFTELGSENHGWSFSLWTISPLVSEVNFRDFAPYITYTVNLGEQHSLAAGLTYYFYNYPLVETDGVFEVNGYWGELYLQYFYEGDFSTSAQAYWDHQNKFFYGSADFSKDWVPFLKGALGTFFEVGVSIEPESFTYSPIRGISNVTALGQWSCEFKDRFSLSLLTGGTHIPQSDRKFIYQNQLVLSF